MPLPKSFGLGRGWPAAPGRAPVLLQLLSLSAATFQVGSAANTVIGALSGLTLGSTLSISPADGRVALSGSSLVVGATAASAGAFSVTVVETLGAATRSTTLTLTCVSGSIVSAAVRARMPFTTGSVSANNVTTTRWREKTNVAVSGVRVEYFNGFVNGAITTAGQEAGSGSAVTLRMSLVTGLSGSGLSTTGTVTPLTFANAAAGAAGFAWNLDGSAANSAQVQARGAVSTDNQTITVPSGVHISTDASSVSLAAGDAYLVQIEEVKKAQQASTGATASGTTATFAVSDVSGLAVGDVIRVAGFAPAGYNGDWPVTAVAAGQVSATVTTSGLAASTTNGNVGVVRVLYLGGRPDLGDAIKASAGTGSYVQTANWTAALAATMGSAMGGAAAVFGLNAAGLKVAATDGDSIVTEVGDWASGSYNSVAYTNVVYGDADGACGFGNRALNAAGYSWVRTGVPGTKPSSITTYGGDAIRKLIRRYSSASLCNHLHNDQAQATGAAFLGVMQSYNARLRAGMLPGSAQRVVNVTGTPTTTSTDNWITDANQTMSGSSAYPSGWVYAIWYPYVTRTGSYAGVSFVATNGDPDAGYDQMLAIRNPVTGKWLTDGSTAKLNTVDGTHPSAAQHVTIATDLQPKLTTLLGF